MSSKLVSIVTIVALSTALPPSAALAQTAATTTVSPSLSVADPGPLQQPELPELKSEGTAFLFSLLGTLFPLALGTAILTTSDDIYYSDASGSAGTLLIYTGLYLGPSLGYFYAGKSGRGWAGFGLRNGIAMLSLVGALAICSDDCDSGATDAGGAIIIAGFVGILGSAIYDLANVQKTVRERNEQQPANRVAVTPTYSRADGPGVRVSLAVR